MFCRSASAEDLAAKFAHPPDTAKPWVYWYFMDGNLTREGMTADLEAMKKAGIGGAIFLEVDIGIPRGPVHFMSPEWQDLLVHAIHEADRLGIQIALGSGPGWCGTGGPWLKPEQTMQHLVASETNVVGPMKFSAQLPRPLPRKPYFGEGTLTPELKKEWQEFYRDVAVLAFPTPDGTNQISDVDEKALYYRDPYTSKPGVKPFLPAPAEFTMLPAGNCVNRRDAIELTAKLSADGALDWDVPAGRWTIMRLGNTLTGQTTRPAPQPGLGFESDKFDHAALDAHFAAFIQKILTSAGPQTNANGGLTMLHFDSWEMGSQNWSGKFREEFRKRRGYDPLKFLPTFTGHVVDSAEISERFLWDVRHTASELVVENHVGHLAELAHKNNLTLSLEPYDLNPAGDLTLGRVADVPQCEFWYHGFDSAFSVIEAASIAHTCGRPIVAAEAFTSEPGEDWKADPAALKQLGDWAFCTGVNRIDFHRFQAQPWNDRAPGMTMGRYGVHWDRTQTWWDMAGAYHEYLARCQFMLQRGVTVADVCFLAAEGAPHVFRPPASATVGNLPDHLGYNFDGCAPETLLERAEVKDGNLIFPGGSTYRILVLPERQTMTPQLLRKIKSLVRDGLTVFGPPPVKSPSLENFPQCDAEVKTLAREIWGDCDGKTVTEHHVGKGRVVWRASEVLPMEQYGDYSLVTGLLAEQNVPPDFEANVPLRFTHRCEAGTDIYFVANPKAATVNANMAFRVTGRTPELWWPDSGRTEQAALFDESGGRLRMPVTLGPNASVFVVFRDKSVKSPQIVSVTHNGSEVLHTDFMPIVRKSEKAVADNFTFATWVKPSAETTLRYETNRSVIRRFELRNEVVTPPHGDSFGGTNHAGFGLAVGNNGVTVMEHGANYFVSPLVYAAAITNWTHVAVVYRDGQPNLYLNGALVRTGLRSSHRVHLRASPDDGQNFSGQFGSFETIMHPLTDAEVASLAKSMARPIFSVTTVPPSVTRNEKSITAEVVMPGRYQFKFANGRKQQVEVATMPGAQEIDGPWEVGFDPKWGGPLKITFDSLDNWSKRPETGIKFYSGTAVYQKAFEIAGQKIAANNRYFLNLGEVKNLARVKLNGQVVGTLWCAPWRVDVTDAIKAGRNDLEIEVANLWPNRLIGDASLPADQRLSWTSWSPYKADSPLLPSGLLGPVTLQTTLMLDLTEK